MKQPPGTPAKHFETVKDLREFLADYEDDDLLLVMLHERAAGGTFAQYRGYYPLGGTDQEGNPVLFVNPQPTRGKKGKLNRDFEPGDIIEILGPKPKYEWLMGLRIEVTKAQNNWVTGKVLRPACPDDRGYPKGSIITLSDASVFSFVERKE